jgi:hypothetical protein
MPMFEISDQRNRTFEWINRALLTLVLLLFPVCAMAGFCKIDPVPHDYHHEFQFFTGYSPQSATLIGTTTGRSSW